MSSGSSESPGSSSEMVTRVPPWQLPIRLLSGVSSAISAGKKTSHVLILTNHQPAIWYHQRQEVTVFFFYFYQMSSFDSQTHAKTNTHKPQDLFLIEYKEKTYSRQLFNFSSQLCHWVSECERERHCVYGLKAVRVVPVLDVNSDSYHFCEAYLFCSQGINIHANHV